MKMHIPTEVVEYFMARAHGGTLIGLVRSEGHDVVSRQPFTDVIKAYCDAVDEGRKMFTVET